MSRLFGGDRTGDGDEFALLNFFLESHTLFDRPVRAQVTVAIAAGSGHHWFLGRGG